MEREREREKERGWGEGGARVDMFVRCLQLLIFFFMQVAIAGTGLLMVWLFKAIFGIIA
jgi:nitrate reductase NapE component